MKLKDGWTKAKVLAQIYKYNNGKKSLREFDRGKFCAYESKDDKGERNRCFVGCFIPDKHKALNVQADAKVLLNVFPDLDLVQFQMVHDMAHSLNSDLDIRLKAKQWLDRNIKE